MAYQGGHMTVDELEHYDPTNDWDTMDSAFMIFVAPSKIAAVEPTICAAVDDGNIRKWNPALEERQALMRHVEDTDEWRSRRERIPLLGVNDGPRKMCTKCGESKGLSLFSADRRNADGRYSWCKQCHRAYLRATYENRKLSA